MEYKGRGGKLPIHLPFFSIAAGKTAFRLYFFYNFHG